MYIVRDNWTGEYDLMENLPQDCNRYVVVGVEDDDDLPEEEI